MLRKLRVRRPSHATVVAYLALFVALGGTSAYAANTVFSSDIIDGEVKSVDIGNNEIGSSDVKDNSLNTFDVHSFLGVDVVDNTVTGADVDESSLNLAAEAWREVGAPGQPAFNNNINCFWDNFDANFNTSAFLRDRFGFVHLKGIVDANNQQFACGDSTNGIDSRIFTLPAGYRPAKREVHVTLTNNALGRVAVDGPDLGLGGGAVLIETPTTFANAEQWISLDGISFRCAPSGQNGCP